MKPIFSKIYHAILIVGLLGLVTCRESTIDPVSFGSLSGTVIDSFNNKPLEGVEINTNPSSNVVYSDSLGNFTMQEIATGEYSFTARLNGYEKTFVNANINAGVNTEIAFKLDRQVLQPDPATNPYPKTGSQNVERNLTLTWESSTPVNDTLSFDVFVYESNIDSAVYSSINSADTFLILNDLRYETTYFWQVVVKSATGGETNGELWTFSTVGFPDNRFTFTSNESGSFQVYSSNDSSNQKIQITRTPYNSLNPRFSTNRKEIAYSANPNLDYQIHIMDFNGANIRQVTNLPIASYHNAGSGFSWWPDNGGFVYGHYEKLISIDRNGSNQKIVTNAPAERHFRSVDYSGGANKIVVQTVGSNIYDGEIYLMNLDGTDTIRLVDNLDGIIESPTFSIDGKQVMYTRDVSGFNAANGRQLDAHIFILDLQTLQEIDVSNGKSDGTNDLQPRFSPDGSKIIFVNTSNVIGSRKDVYIMNVNGSNRELLFENSEMPDWH